jgi:hypothetical protein
VLEYARAIHQLNPNAVLYCFAQRDGPKEWPEHQTQQIGLKLKQHPLKRGIEQGLGAVAQTREWPDRRREAQPVHWKAVYPALSGFNIARRQTSRRLRIGREHPHFITSRMPLLSLVPRAHGAAVA